MIILVIPLALAAAVFGLIQAWETWWGFYALQGDSWAWVWKHQMAYGRLPGFVQWGILGAAAGAVALIVIAQALASRIGGRTVHGQHDDKTLHGSARWAFKSEVKKAGL